jgi:hypothetical protein
VVEGDSLQCLDRPYQCGADLALYPAQQLEHPRLAEVYPHDGLQVGHGREQVGPEEGYTLMNEDQRTIELKVPKSKTDPSILQRMVI